MEKTEIAIAPIEGYAAIYGEADLNGDIIVPGALSEAKTKPHVIRLLYQHAAEIPAGRWLKFEEHAKGLYAYGEIIIASDAQRERHALLQAGALDGLSIGFRTVKAKKIAGGRRILKADLWEVSLVTFPMAPRARLSRVGQARPVAEITIPNALPSQTLGRAERSIGDFYQVNPFGGDASYQKGDTAQRCGPTPELGPTPEIGPTQELGPIQEFAQFLRAAADVASA
ncbi:MAG: HK97 family phage prohead protease [Pseudomonadota bacterium]